MFGKIKENYLQDATHEYSKRLSKFCKLDIIQIPDEKLPATLSQGNIDIVKDKEANLIISKLEQIKSKYIFVLDETGKEFSSIDFAKTVENVSNTNSTIIFVIGGSLGLSQKVRDMSNELISFSKMTFPHQLIRVFLLEQLFRSFKINGNETYHH